MPRPRFTIAPGPPAADTPPFVPTLQTMAAPWKRTSAPPRHTKARQRTPANQGTAHAPKPRPHIHISSHIPSILCLDKRTSEGREFQAEKTRLAARPRLSCYLLFPSCHIRADLPKPLQTRRPSCPAKLHASSVKQIDSLQFRQLASATATIAPFCAVSNSSKSPSPNHTY